MTKASKSIVVYTMAALLVTMSLAQAGPGGKGDDNQIQQQDRLQDCVLTPGSLTEIEIAHVLFMRQEEKLARDVYITFQELWQADVFARIAVSEQRHMDAVGQVITALELDDPAADNTVGVFNDEAFVSLFGELTATGEVSYIEALKVGAYIEELDILDLITCLTEVENECVINLFEHLMEGSCTHLQAFVNALAAEGVTYTPQLMTKDLYDQIISGPTAGGPR